MQVSSLAELETLSKDELLEVATDRQNTKEIQELALECWLLLDDKEFSESITRLRQLIDTTRRLLRRSDDASAGHGTS